MDDSSDLRDQPGVVSRFFSSLELVSLNYFLNNKFDGEYSVVLQKYQYYLDRLTPFTTVRWLINLVFNALFIARMVYLQVWLIDIFKYEHENELRVSTSWHMLCTSTIWIYSFSSSLLPSILNWWMMMTMVQSFLLRETMNSVPLCDDYRSSSSGKPTLSSHILCDALCYLIYVNARRSMWVNEGRLGNGEKQIMCG